MAKKYRKGSKKGRQQSHNKATKKYYHTFYRHVLKFGKWRGKKASISQAY